MLDQHDLFEKQRLARGFHLLWCDMMAMVVLRASTYGRLPVTFESSETRLVHSWTQQTSFYYCLIALEEDWCSVVQCHALVLDLEAESLHTEVVRWSAAMWIAQVTGELLMNPRQRKTSGVWAQMARAQRLHCSDPKAQREMLWSHLHSEQGLALERNRHNNTSLSLFIKEYTASGNHQL